MDALELRDGCRLDPGDAYARTLSTNDLLRAPKLVHGKWMLFRQRIRVARMIEAAHAGNMGHEASRSQESFTMTLAPFDS